jgi:hypothetical protein
MHWPVRCPSPSCKGGSAVVDGARVVHGDGAVVHSQLRRRDVKASTGGRYLRPAVRAGCSCAVYLREPVLPTSSNVLQAWACLVVPVSWPCQGICEASAGPTGRCRCGWQCWQLRKFGTGWRQVPASAPDVYVARLWRSSWLVSACSGHQQPLGASRREPPGAARSRREPPGATTRSGIMLHNLSTWYTVS